MRSKVLLSTLLSSAFFWQTNATNQIKLSVRYHEGGNIISHIDFDVNERSMITDADGL